MAGYTEVTIQEAEEILSLYGFEKVHSIEALTFGISNSNYKVTLKNNDALILKISNDKGFEELVGEQQVLQYLKQNEFPYCLAPHLTNNGASVYKWREHVGVVFPFVHGIVPEISAHKLRLIAKALAQLHLVSEQNQQFSHLRNHIEVGFDLENLSQYVTTNECPNDFKEAFVEIFPPNKIQKILQQKFPIGVIHGDMYYDNTLFIDDEIQVILDFEQAGVGKYLFDLGVSISGSCLREGKIDLELLNVFVEGYQSIRPLQKSEHLFLNEAILTGLLSISRWRIKRFIENKISIDKTESYKELLERALLFKKDIKL